MLSSSSDVCDRVYEDTVFYHDVEEDADSFHVISPPQSPRPPSACGKRWEIKQILLSDLNISHCDVFLLGSQKSPRPRRQRTTSMSKNITINTCSESVLRSHRRTIYTAGRPPWYNCAGEQVKPFVIGKLLVRLYLNK